jgi:DNA-binding NarL/FixJ family response regulator
MNGVLQLMKTVEFKPLSPLRSCFRCGSEFRSDKGDRVCPGCRVPAGQRKSPLNPKLSFREKQVVKLVSQAKLNKEIAYELHLSEGTIKEYLNRIFRKVGTSNRTELAVWALTRQGAIGTDEYVA